ncbi:membrane protein [Spirochaetia bacterium]|nr:membrane protein [Spirochaetia bacterium]
MKKTEDREIKISFQSKESYTCPVCNAGFHREELLSGSGRFIAGNLTDELHRLYEPSLKYGDIYPLAYQATVCPECWFASMDKDFSGFPKANMAKVIQDEEKRKQDTLSIFPGVDFHENRGLVSGAASLYLVVRCYDFFPKEFSPTIKQGIAALRTGWLLDEINVKNPGQHYDWLATLFKKKAQFLYNDAIRREQSGVENLSSVKVFGPDTDKNYAYEGALYLCALLKSKYGPMADAAQRTASLEEARRTVAKVFGMGKSSKAKPGSLLESAKALYENISKELNQSNA